MQQQRITLPVFPRGIHVITHDITVALSRMEVPEVGLAHLFLQHTSASLAINESADPDVRLDAEDWLNKIAPENQPEYRHTLEGSDDLPSHFKNMMLGTSLTIPITNHKLALGTWQGIYLCEHRNHASGRHVVITLM